MYTYKLSNKVDCMWLSISLTEMAYIDRCLKINKHKCAS